MKLSWCACIAWLCLVVFPTSCANTSQGASHKKLVNFQSNRSQSFVRTWRRILASPTISSLDDEKSSVDNTVVTTSSIVQAIQIVLEADRGLFAQLLINVFVTLNGLVEYLVSSKFQYAVRSQCLSAAMLSQCFELFRSSRLNFDYLTEPDIDSAALDEAKSAVSVGLTKFGGHLIAFSAIAFFSGAKTGSLVPVLVSQIPFYCKYALLLLLTRRLLIVRSMNKDNASASTQSTKRRKVRTAAQVMPMTESVLRVVAMVSPRLLRDLSRENAPDASLDHLLPTDLSPASSSTTPPVSAASGNGTIISETSILTTSHPVEMLPDPLDRCSELASGVAEAMYLLQASLEVLGNLAQQRVRGVFDLAAQWLLLFLTAQYLFVRATTLMRGSLFTSSSGNNVIQQVVEALRNLITPTATTTRKQVSKVSKKKRSKKAKKKVIPPATVEASIPV